MGENKGPENGWAVALAYVFAGICLAAAIGAALKGLPQ
jgi:hypothetical protein